ncbi:unnamed protein product [Lymnaea stagnalis]|uniref:Cysteine and tyrosine-rich protein 1 n=1 Tax=Lymnaea stagnalis TaxID=6523 RepID=A0AAV2HCX1_LYMST
MEHRRAVVVFLTLIQAITVFGDTCYEYDASNSLTSSYCAYGCCGTYMNRYCCSYSYSSYSSAVSSVFSIGTIVGIAVGSFAGFVILIVTIVLICKKCTAPTRVVNVIGPPAQGGAVVTQTSGMMSQGGTAGQVPAYNPPLYGY